MQGSNYVSNLVLWARIKKKKKWGGSEITPEIRFCLIRKKKRWNSTSTCSDSSKWVVYESGNWVNSYFVGGRKSVDCVIVLYDWNLIIYSLLPTRQTPLCPPCYCCNNTSAFLTCRFIRLHAESLMRGSIPLLYLKDEKGEIIPFMVKQLNMI